MKLPNPEQNAAGRTLLLDMVFSEMDRLERMLTLELQRLRLNPGEFSKLGSLGKTLALKINALRQWVMLEQSSK